LGKFRFSCTAALLCGFAPRGVEALKESLDEEAGVKQLGQRAQARERRHAGAGIIVRCLFRGALQIGPFRRDQRTAAVGQDQEQVQAVVTMRPPQQLQGLSLEGVVGAKNGDRRRKTVEVGSVSYGPSTTSIGTS
jgi:hypothetical protein